ncbi:ATP binding protein [Aureococcus anophagefferens]|nr:ATP binding protein [Aureococcus anophagefferens]KAH8060007.1 ATP binding protein [Aureococcus anophagefferens]
MASLTVGQGRVPVTVLIGYLGSGKTTLLNRILVERSDKKYAVIVNEFGELGIDDRLVRRRIDAEEDIFEMNNGCICCTVRADLSRILNKLLAPGMKELDGVIVETTGLADPAPVAQTFFVDEHLEEQKPDGVENEAVEQVAFADRILLNKCDLLDEGELAAVESKLRSLNKVAPLKRCERAKGFALDFVLGVEAFDLKKVLDIEPDFLDTDGEHVHDDSITSIGLRQAGALDMVRVNAWLTDLLAKEGVNIFRMKGILNIRGQDMKFVFQGVHMLFSGEPLEPWNDEPRESRIVFIGRDLKKESLERHLASCLA